jgi:hypothetical protein
LSKLIGVANVISETRSICETAGNVHVVPSARICSMRSSTDSHVLASGHWDMTYRVMGVELTRLLDEDALAAREVDVPAGTELAVKDT